MTDRIDPIERTRDTRAYARDAHLNRHAYERSGDHITNRVENAMTTKELVRQGTLPACHIDGVLPSPTTKEGKRYQDAIDAVNAQKAIKSLIPDGKDGLNQKDIEDRLKDKTITNDQRRALEWMKKNYDDLYAHSWSKDGSRITPESLKKYSSDSTTFDGGLGLKKEIRDVERLEKIREESVRRRVDSMKEETAQPGDGLWRIAQRSLQKRGFADSNETIVNEVDRLRNLNGFSRNHVIRPGDKIRILDKEDVESEVKRRLKS